MPKKKYNSKFSKDHEKWAEMYISGRSTYAIAVEYKCNPKTVNRRLAIMGVAIRKDGFFKDAVTAYETLVVRKSGACWEWKGGTSKGYPFFSASGVQYAGHRYSYELHKGSAEGMVVCHTCDNPTCTNPDHLFIGTYSDNSKDCINKKRKWGQKLSVDDVLEIRERLMEGEKCVDMAIRYGVHVRTVEKIKNRIRWSHI